MSKGMDGHLCIGTLAAGRGRMSEAAIRAAKVARPPGPPENAETYRRYPLTRLG